MSYKFLVKELENNNSTKSSTGTTSNEGDNKLKSVKTEENVDVPTTSGYFVFFLIFLKFF